MAVGAPPLEDAAGGPAAAVLKPTGTARGAPIPLNELGLERWGGSVAMQNHSVARFGFAIASVSWLCLAYFNDDGIPDLAIADNVAA